MSRFQINIQDYRAIKSADIIIDGITVLTGPNGSGKSTLSKVFFHFLKNVMSFEDKVNVQFIDFFKDISYQYYRMLKELMVDDNFSLGLTRRELYDRPSRIRDNKEINELKNNIIVDIQKFDNMIQEMLKGNPDEAETIVKYFSGLRRRFLLDVDEEMNYDEDSSSSQTHINAITRINNAIIQIIEDKNNKRIEQISKRKIEDFFIGINADFFDKEIVPENIECSMDMISLLKKDGSIESINPFDIVYIEPTHDVEGIRSDIDEDLHKMVHDEKRNAHKNLHIDDLLISSSFLDGDIIAEDSELKFQQNNKVYSIEECASGINSVASLIMLYKHGYINSESVIIIDEPEVHLHPQWTVEYAAFIVALRKELKATFLITSHSPDFVLALQTIAIEKGEEKFMNFYLSYPVEEDKYKFIFEHTGTEIGKIFDSFNKSYTRIDEYNKDE